jgi:RNA polymerase sigma-70 factor (ECF subfamily)
MAIVRHRLADHARHYARRGAHELPLEGMDVTSEAVLPKFLEGGPWEIDALTRAIRVLPRSQQQAITLLKLQELSLKDAAAITGLTVGALKVATHRAMATLRRVLGRSLR